MENFRLPHLHAATRCVCCQAKIKIYYITLRGYHQMYFTCFLASIFCQHSHNLLPISFNPVNDSIDLIRWWDRGWNKLFSINNCLSICFEKSFSKLKIRGADTSSWNNKKSIDRRLNSCLRAKRVLTWAIIMKDTWQRRNHKLKVLIHFSLRSIIWGWFQTFPCHVN